MDTLSKYGQSFQSKIISALLTDVKLLDSLNDIIDKNFFESDVNKWIVGVIIDYYEEYKKQPTMDVFKSEVCKMESQSMQRTIIEQLKTVYTHIEHDDIEYVKNEFETFCKNQNLKSVIIQSVDLLKLGNYDKIKDLVDKAMKVGSDVDLGTDYILDYEKRTSDDARKTIATDWDVINKLMGSGLGSGELGVVVAPSGVGKTWFLCALGAAAVKSGKTVIHYSMELSEKYVGERYDTVFTQISSADLFNNRNLVRDKISKLNGKLLIKYFPPKGISVKKIEYHIEKLTAIGNKPDIIILDYADLLLSRSIKSNNVYTEQGDVYIELRALGSEFNIPVWTASQTNRSGLDAEVIEADKIADSYAKVMNADFIMSVSRKPMDKINNTARVHIMKNRFGMDGITFSSMLDTNKGIIEIHNTPSATTQSNLNNQNDDGYDKQLLYKKYIENMPISNNGIKKVAF
jgi:replicative DNA helicase